MLGQNNISHVFVGKNTALATGAVSAMTAGQIGVFVDGSATAQNTALTAGERFKVILKDSAGKLINSPFTDFDYITSKNDTNYTAPTERKVHVGYNGTDGSIAVANSEVYTMHMNMQDGTKTWGEHPLFKLVAAYKSDASATQAEIADALYKNAVKNFNREIAYGTDYIKVNLINSAALATGLDFDGTLTVTQGSNVATVTASGEYNTAAGTIAVGDYIRLGATSTTAVALTSSVYKVTAISGTTTKTLTLDGVVTEASGSYVTGSDYNQVIPSATAVAANYGLVFEAKPLAFDPGLLKYQKLHFDLQLGDGFGATENRVTTGASKGEGTYMEVAENEWLLNGNRGETFRVASYPVAFPLNADSTKTYDAVVVHFTNNNSIQIDHEVKSYISYVFYVETDTAGTSGSTAYTNLKTVFGL